MYRLWIKQNPSHIKGNVNFESFLMWGIKGLLLNVTAPKKSTATQITFLWVCTAAVELRWNDLCQVCRTTSGWRPCRAAPSGPHANRKKHNNKKKQNDNDFLAFQIFPAARSAEDASSHTYSIPAAGRLGTISLQAWPILLLPSHTLFTPQRGQGTDEPRTSFLTLLSFESGWMSVTLPSSLKAW